MIQFYSDFASKWKQNSCNIRKNFVMHSNAFFIQLTWILETKILICSFQCLCIAHSLHFGINESLMTLWLAYLIDSDPRPVSNRRPLLKSASTDCHYLKSRSNFRIFSNRHPFQTRIPIGPFTQSKFAIKNNCNDSFILRVFFYLFLKVVFCFVCF